MTCFFLKFEKEEECQNLLFLASSVKVGLYLWKLGTKKEKLKNDARKLSFEIMRKRGHLGWILGKTRRRKQEEKVGLLGDFSGNWLPGLLRKIGLEPKVEGIF